MGKTRTGKVAIGLTMVGFIFVVIAFTTPNWLQTDGKLNSPKFHKIGLWQVCLEDFSDTQHLYNNRFTGCSWVFEEKYYILHDILLPGFFVGTQFMFTLCFTLLLIGIFLTALYACCSRQQQKFQILLWTNGSILTLSGVSGIISVLIFGCRGDYRDWMPNWQHNDIGWSYAMGVVGSFIVLTAGILFLVEGRRYRRKVERIINDDQKTHTTI